MGINTRLFLGALVGLAAVIVLGASFLHFTARQEHYLVIAAGSHTGEGFELAEAIAEVTRRYHPRYEVEVVETAGSVESLRLLEEGRVQLATIQADMTPPPSARLVAPVFPDVYQLVVRRGADEASIRSVADLRGRRIALPPAGSGQVASFWNLATHYGLEPSDLRALSMTLKSANYALQVGAVDGVFRVRAPGNRSVRELIQNPDTELIPIAQAAAMRLGQPALTEGTIPKGSYRGHPPLPAEDLPSVEVQRLLVASEATPAEDISVIAHVLFERRRDLIAVTPLAGFIETPDQSRGTFMPLHAGAQQFFDREKPSFWTEHAELMALIVTISVLAGSGLLGLRSRWDSNQKNRIDHYNQDLVRLCYEARADTSNEGRARHETRLLDIFARAVEDLDRDQVTQDGFDMFSFAWQAANSLVRGGGGGTNFDIEQAVRHTGSANEKPEAS